MKFSYVYIAKDVLIFYYSAFFFLGKTKFSQNGVFNKHSLLKPLME